MKQYYIGLSASTHDSGLAIVNTEGEVVFAEATERFLQYKRAPNCEPDNARLIELLAHYCEADAEIIAAVNWRKITVFSSKLLTQLGLTSPKTILNSSSRDVKFSTPFSLRTKMINACAASMYNKLGVGLTYALKMAFGDNKCTVRYFPHHLCHAALACYSSPYKEASCLIVDGAGDFGSFAFYRYDKGHIELIKEQRGFTSLGRFYADMTWLCGFNPDQGEEWKVMGYAAYGTLDNEIYEALRSIFKFSGCTIKSIAHKNYARILTHIQQQLSNGALNTAILAHTAQRVFSDVLLQLIDRYHPLNPSDNLALAGGCVLNSSTAGLICANTKFSNLYIPSAPADDGTALGAALLAQRQDHPASEPQYQLQSPYLGSTMPSQKLQQMVRSCKNPNIAHFPECVHRETAKLLSDGKIVGWVQGRAEFGPRALGNRSILADPRSKGMKDQINSLIKFREEFRPFAPSILHEYGPDYFVSYQESPYMERTLQFNKEAYDKVPAVVHVDGSGRLQTVKPEWNRKFYDLIHAFYELTGIPILLNTSFNVMGKPIIHSIEDAISVFYTTGLDVLVIDDYLIKKE